jgi:fructose-1,6-bisphosphatase I
MRHETSRMSSLADYLRAWAGPSEPRAQIAATVAALAEGSVRVATMLAEGPQEGDQDDGAHDAARRASALLATALDGAPVAWLATEGSDTPVSIQPGSHLAVALDPLDGARNAAVGAPAGTIFSILPVRSMAGSHGSLAFLQQGDRQLAAGCVLHGSYTALALTLREGTDLFMLDRGSGIFRLTRRGVKVPSGRYVYAINAANYRYWSESVRAYVDDCIAGEDGPRGTDFNMRWLGCVTAEAMRILQRGGIYLYPGDSRPDHRQGRLHLVFDAHPLALLIEQAGGAASDGVEPILKTAARRLNERSPLVFGAREKVERVAGYETMNLPLGERSPLFGRRGLFRV